MTTFSESNAEVLSSKVLEINGNSKKDPLLFLFLLGGIIACRLSTLLVSYSSSVKKNFVSMLCIPSETSYFSLIFIF